MYVAIICARDFCCADSDAEFVEGVEGVSVGDGALCVGASSVDDITDTSSCINSPSDRKSDFEVKFVVRAAIRLERGCLLGIEPRAVKLALEEWAHPVGFLSGSPLFARLSDCPATVKVAGSLRRLGGGEKRVTQKLEIARRHTSDATSQSSDFPVSCQVTWPFLLAIPVSFLCLAGPCLAGGGPAWRPACCARGLGGRGLAGGWLAGDLPAVARLGPGRRHTAHNPHSQNSHSPSPRTR